MFTLHPNELLLQKPIHQPTPHLDAFSFTVKCKIYNRIIKSRIFEYIIVFNCSPSRLTSLSPTISFFALYSLGSISQNISSESMDLALNVATEKDLNKRRGILEVSLWLMSL